MPPRLISDRSVCPYVWPSVDVCVAEMPCSGLLSGDCCGDRLPRMPIANADGFTSRLRPLKLSKKYGQSPVSTHSHGLSAPAFVRLDIAVEYELPDAPETMPIIVSERANATIAAQYETF